MLRVEPPDLAKKLRKWMREEQGLEGRVDLVFDTGKHAAVRRMDLHLACSCQAGGCRRCCWRLAV